MFLPGKKNVFQEDNPHLGKRSSSRYDCQIEPLSARPHGLSIIWPIKGNISWHAEEEEVEEEEEEDMLKLVEDGSLSN